MTAAAVVAAMSSCSEKFVSGDVVFTTTADALASWSGNEMIAVSVNGGDIVSFQATKGNASAFTSTLTDCAASGTIYVASPFDREGFGINDITASAVVANIPDIQTARSGFPDADAQILIGKADYTDALPANLNINMTSACATVRIIVKNAPESISTATVTFPANVAGKFNIGYEGTWSEQEGTSKITVKNTSDEIFFNCAPVNVTGDVTVELTGKATGAKYPVTFKAEEFSLKAGSLTTVTAEIPLNLYIVGTAIGKETADEAEAMTKNADGSFSWTGAMAANSEFKLIFDREKLTPAFTLGNAFNNIRYSTRVTAAPFEIEKAGTYRITVWPEHAHIQVCRIFDHVLASASGAGPLNTEFDNCEPVTGHPHDWETRFGPLWQNHGYDTFGIDKSFKLSGENSYWVNVTWIPEDWTQGRIIRSGDWEQPIATAGKTYTVMMQMMYEGNAPEEIVKWRVEGAIGTGDGYVEDVTLESGVPVQICKDFTADETWGGCVNIFVYFTEANLVEEQPFRFYLDAVNIGYDD